MVARVPVAVLLLTLLAPSASALYDDLTFTTVLTDPQDHVGFLDIREVAVAESGAGELVVRYTYDTSVPAQAAFDFDFFFTADGTAWSTGIGGDGSAAGNGNFDVPAVKTCAIDGGKGYCALDYAAFGSAVGDTLTATYAISYAGAIQDYGPGLGGASASVQGVRGADYTLTGCTRTDGACPSAAATGPVYGNLSTPSLLQTFNGTTATYVYNFTNAAAGVVLSFNVTGNGSLALNVTDGAGAQAFNRSFSGPDAGTQSLAGAAAGNWTYTLVLDNFTGSVALDLSVPPAASGSGSATKTSTAASTASSTKTGSAAPGGNATEDDDADSADTPAPGLFLAAGAVAIALVLRRRR